MNTRKTLLILSAALLVGGQATAQSDNDRVVAEVERREAEAAQAMREAERQLEEAARRIAELSNERLGALGEAERWVMKSDRPRLGVNIDMEGAAGAPVEGVTILSVTPGSPADESGLRAGDVITAVNGETLSAATAEESAMELLQFMKTVEAGDELDIEYLRDGKVGSIEVEPRVMDLHTKMYAGNAGAVMPKVMLAPGEAKTFSFSFGGWRGGWGDMELVELNAGLGRYFGTDQGLLVISAPKSNAFKLKDGDVIRSIDGRDPTSVSHCMRILTSYQPGEKLTLAIMRDKQEQTIEVEVPDDRTSWLVPRVAPPLPVKPVSAPQPPAAAPVAPERT